jgi:CRISPR-associated protein Csb2
MIAISLRFLAGRYHATPWSRHVNEGAVEWPPSLWRLLRALVAVYHRARPAGVSEGQLREIVSALAEPPVFHLPPATTAHTRHYDVANDSVKFFDTFIALDPSASVICLWRDVNLSGENRTALAALLRSLNTLGRAESWCEATLLDDVPDCQINSQRLEAGQSLSRLESVQMLVPDKTGADIYDALLIETSAMRKQKMLEPYGTQWLTYTRRADALSQRRALPPRHTPKATRVTVARFALNSTVLPLVQDALPFAELVRRALIRNRVDTAHSEAIVGKTIDGVPLEGHLHAHYLATDEDQDGRIDHITIYAECGFDRADVAALGALSYINRYGNRPDVRMVLTGLGKRDDFGQTPLFDLSRHWRSVTPFSLPRFASRGGGKPPRPRDLPEAQLVRELRLRGLPEPVSIKRVEGYQVNDRPLVSWLDFHTRRFKGDEGHGLAGFEIEFPELVPGPIALGFACHFSLGLFAPVFP